MSTGEQKQPGVPNNKASSTVSNSKESASIYEFSESACGRLQSVISRKADVSLLETAPVDSVPSVPQTKVCLGMGLLQL